MREYLRIGRTGRPRNWKNRPALAGLLVILLTIVVLLTIVRPAPRPSHTAQVIGCTPPAFCGDFTVTGTTPLTTTFIPATIGGQAPYSYSWNFGDGSTGNGSPTTHTFAQGTYLVSLTSTDANGASFTIKHDVTEMLPPSNSFVQATLPSWNPHVSCLASGTTVPEIIGNITSAQGGADLSGRGSVSIILKHTLSYPCSVFGYSVFVQIPNVTVTYGPFTTTDCSLYYGTSTCDIVGRIADFNSPCNVCFPGTIYMQEMRWELERQWNASGYDSDSLSAYGQPQIGQNLDIQGFLWWSFNTPYDSNHDYSSWYLELTGWKPAATSRPPPIPTFTPTFTLTASAPSPDLVLSGGSATSTITVTSVNGFNGTVSLTAATSPPGLTVNINPANVNIAAGGLAYSTLNIGTTASTPIGVYDLTLNADGSVQSISQVIQVSLTVVSRPPPVLTVPGSQNVTEGSILNFKVVATDPDQGDVLTLSANELPSGASFDLATSDFSWTPSSGQKGNYTVTFIVTESGVPPQSDEKSVNIEVTMSQPPSPPPSPPPSNQPQNGCPFCQLIPTELSDLWLMVMAVVIGIPIALGGLLVRARSKLERARRIRRFSRYQPG